MSTPELKVFGVFRSGTNLVRALLQLNYNVLVHSNTHAYKHLPVPASYKDSTYQPFPIRIVGIVKDPFAFLDSAFRYCEEKNFLNIEGGRTFDEFIRQRFVVFDGGFKNFPRYRFANPVQYWNSINFNLLSLPEDQCVLVRYESLLSDKERVVAGIADKFGLVRTSTEFIEPPGITENLDDRPVERPEDYVTDRPFERQRYYLERQYMQRFSDEQKDFVFSELDLDLLTALSYPLSTSILENEKKKSSFVQDINELVRLGQANIAALELLLDEERAKTEAGIVETLELEIASLHNQVAELESRLELGEEKCNNLGHEITSLEADVESLKLKNQHLQLLLDTAKKENSKLNLALKTARERAGKSLIDDLNNKLKATTEIIPETPRERRIQSVRIDKAQSDLNIACILDEFSTQCYRYECNLIPVPLQGWTEVLSETRPDLLIVESAWKGTGGEWEFKIGTYANQDKSELRALLDWCSTNRVPTVFWNKEDPIHFDKFIDAAKLFDVIFTTDAGLIPRYQKEAGHDLVFSLQFAAQPHLHNPIKKYEKEDKICFAGSYYANRHQDRRRDMDEILDIAQEFGLIIYDRNYEKNLQGETAFSFPERFRKNIVGSLSYSEIDKAYKGYKYLLNVNSVKDSSTMFSRRVFEGLACGTLLLSTYSRGVKKTFKDLVIISENGDELRSSLQALQADHRLYEKKSIQGIREVFSKHLYSHRLGRILEKAGIATNSKPAPRVTMACVVGSETDISRATEVFQRQSYPHKKLVLFLDGFDDCDTLLNRYNKAAVSTVHLSSAISLGSRLGEYVKPGFVAFIDLLHHYGDHYLVDLVQAALYAEADVIGKCAYFTNSDGQLRLVQGAEYEYSANLQCQSSIIDSRLLVNLTLDAAISKLRSGKPVADIFEQEAKGFSIHKYNFVALANKPGARLPVESILHTTL